MIGQRRLIVEVETEVVAIDVVGRAQAGDGGGQGRLAGGVQHAHDPPGLADRLPQSPRREDGALADLDSRLVLGVSVRTVAKKHGSKGSEGVRGRRVYISMWRAR